MPGVDYESMLSELGKFGASFILATQSLAKLDDLSPTMRDTMRWLAAMPFLDRLELAAVTGMSDGTGHYVLGRLQGQGLVDCIRHGCGLTPSSRRWWLTGDGLARLAGTDGAGVGRLLRTRPVSARWHGCSWPVWTEWRSSTRWPRRWPALRGRRGSGGTGAPPWTPP